MEMPDLITELACHTLALREDTPYMTRRRQKNSPKKVEPTRKAMDNLL